MFKNRDKTQQVLNTQVLHIAQIIYNYTELYNITLQFQEFHQIDEGYQH